MAYLGVLARFQLKHERRALHFLRLAGFETYVPRPAPINGPGTAAGSRSRRRCFRGYAFVAIEAPMARRAPGAGNAGARHERLAALRMSPTA